MKVALVGNGPIASNAGAQVDAHDLVVRLNACNTFGTSGSRVDVLALVNTGLPGRNFALTPGALCEPALSLAGEVWLTKSPALFENESTAPKVQVYGIDYSSLIATNKLGGKRWRYIDPEAYVSAWEALKGQGATGVFEPSTGMVVLFALRRISSNYRVTLFGFTHCGWSGHQWEAERRQIASLCEWVSYG